MATHYVLIRYDANGGTIANSPHNYAGGFNYYSSYTASKATHYYTKLSGSTVQSCATKSGTYVTYQSRAASTTSYPDLCNVTTLGITRTGYHIETTSSYRTAKTGGKILNADYSSTSTVNPATYANLGGSTSSNKTVTIYVNWLPNTYKVVFNANGGSGTMSDQTGFRYGTSKALSSNTFTRTGYTFLGWSTSSTATTATYTDGQSVSNLTTTNNGTVTLYAVWQAIVTIILAYDPNGGSGASTGPTSATYDQSFTMPSTTPVRTGYTFLGWSMGYGATQSIVMNMAQTKAANHVVDIQPSETITWSTPAPYAGFSASWQGISYSVAFNANGGSGTMATQTGFVYGTAKALSSNAFTAPAGGYSFQGWATSSAGAAAGTVDYGNGANMTTGTTTSGGTVTLYAVWKRTITFKFADGTQSTADQYYGGNLATPSVGNISTGSWTGLGWRDDTTADASEYSANSSVSYTGTATTLYAVYSRTLTQTYNANGGSGTAPTAKTATQYYNAEDIVSTSTFSAQTNPFTLSGWSFYKWSTSSDPSSGTVYSETDTPTWNPSSSTSTLTRTLYVRWQRWITFNYDSGSSMNQQVRGGSTYSNITPPTIPSLSQYGWTALGWRNDSTPSTPNVTQFSPYTGSSLFLAAVYSRTVLQAYGVLPGEGSSGTPPADQTATQYYNPGAGYATDVVVSTVSFVLPTNTFNRPGYKFDKWSLGYPGNTVYWAPSKYEGDTTGIARKSAAIWIPVIYIKQSDVWEEAVPQIKVSGTWKIPNAVYVKVSGTWKQIY